MGILQKIQRGSLWTRKVIFWTIIIVVGLVLLIGWVALTGHRIKNFKGESFFERLDSAPLEESYQEMKETIEKTKEMASSSEAMLQNMMNSTAATSTVATSSQP